jgi:hypothetical protein
MRVAAHGDGVIDLALQVSSADRLDDEIKRGPVVVEVREPPSSPTPVDSPRCLITDFRT